MNHVYLYGPPGSGKTTVSKELAVLLGRTFVDIDSEIEKKYSLPVSEIISTLGESVFREYESETIHRVSKNNLPLVIALGGGALLRDKNLDICENSGRIIFLEANESVIIRRICEDNSIRPLLAGDTPQKLKNLLQKRKNHYDTFKLRVVTNINNPLENYNNINQNRSLADICNEILVMINVFRVTGMGQAYNVYVENGGLNNLGKYLNEIGLSGKAAVVLDDNLDALYRQGISASFQNIGIEPQFIVIPHGEENKTLETVSYLWKQFLQLGLDRSSTVISFGGGVVSDLSGFAASTFMRGCSWCAVPTSLLAMVDASIGGKTGFDTVEGKNLIGTFYPPKFVLVDPLLLQSLPDIEFRSGMAEVIKHGIINDPELFDLCSRGYEFTKLHIENIICKAIKVKVDTIVTDPFEKGIRAALNLGHTIGHAIEIASNYRLKHGEAVSIGIILEAKLAEQIGIALKNKGLSKLLKSVLEKFSLPTEIPVDIAKIDIVKAIQFDKKKDKGKIRFSLPVEIGKVEVNISVENLESVI